MEMKAGRMCAVANRSVWSSLCVQWWARVAWSVVVTVNGPLMWWDIFVPLSVMMLNPDEIWYQLKYGIKCKLNYCSIYSNPDIYIRFSQPFNYFLMQSGASLLTATSSPITWVTSVWCSGVGLLALWWECCEEIQVISYMLQGICIIRDFMKSREFWCKDILAIIFPI